MAYELKHTTWFIGPERAVNNWRCTWPAAALRRAGHNALAMCEDGDVTEADLAPGDTVVVHHGVQGGTRPAGFKFLAPFLATIRREVAPRRLVVQYDDSFMDYPDLQDVAPDVLDSLLADQRDSCAIADAVVVTTPYLAEQIPGAEVVPNWIASWVCELNLPLTLGRKAVWLGTLGGVPRGGERASAHLHDWQWATTSDPPSDFPLHVVGVRDYREHFWFRERFPAYTYRRHTTDLRHLYKMVAEQACVGLAPVDPGLAFNRGKSWIKPLECAALGLDSVAAETEEYIRLGLPMLASAEKFWDVALAAMEPGRTRHEDLRADVRDRLSVEANVGRWVEVLGL